MTSFSMATTLPSRLRLSANERYVHSMRHIIISFLFALALTSACGGTQHPAAQKGLLPVGSEVPALIRVDQRGKVISLRSNTPTLLYFYPRDGTPGCTKEACALRDAWDQYMLASIRVIGVSTDSDESHRAFAEEYDLPFSLIADPERTWADALGVAKFAGNMDERVSFLIDGQGRIVKSYDKVDPGVHAEEVLSDAKALGLAH